MTDLATAAPVRPVPALKWEVKAYGRWHLRLKPKGAEHPTHWLEELQGLREGFLRCDCGGTSDDPCPHVIAVGEFDPSYQTRPLAVLDPPIDDLFPSTGAQDYHENVRREQNDCIDELAWAEAEASDAPAL